MVKYLQEDYSRIKSILENQYLVETAAKFQIIISFSRPCGTDHFWFSSITPDIVRGYYLSSLTGTDNQSHRDDIMVAVSPGTKWDRSILSPVRDDTKER